jgi:hypothetical protein
VVFTFTGGSPSFYNDGRNHAWYSIDNITYTPMPIPEPSAVFLLSLGTAAGVGSRRRTRR